jgi:hypothetical protein
MNEKISIYDLLATLVPGTLVLGLLAVVAPDTAAGFKRLNLPDAFAVIVLVALAIFAGNMVQALASLVEKPLYFTWLWKRDLRPSEYCLEHGLGGYLPKDSAARIKGKLAAVLGAKAQDRSLFLYAMQLAESATNQRVTVFNALFAYHRALFMFAVIGVVVSGSVLLGAGSVKWSLGLRWGILVTSVLVTALLWNRTKQRAFYYVREVLLTAERVIDQKAAAPTVAAAVTAPSVVAAPAAQSGNGASAPAGGNQT